MYDKYKLILSGMEMYSIDDLIKYKQCIDDSKNLLKMLYNVNIRLQVENLIEPSNELFENIRIDVTTNELKLDLRETQIEFLIEMLAKFKSLNMLLKQDFENTDENKITEVTETVIPNFPEKTKSFLNLYSKAGILKLNSVMIKNDKNIVKFKLSVKRMEFNLLKSITESERYILNLSENCEFSPFKEFLNFNTNRIILSLVVTEKKNISLFFSISNIFLFDYDYDYVKTNDEILNVIKQNHLNREFFVKNKIK